MATQAWLALPLVLVAAPATLAPQDATESRVARIVGEHTTRSDADAFGVKVLIGADTLIATGRGRLEAHGTRDADADTLFPAGSMAHAWLATALLRKLESDAIALDTHVHTVLPGLLPESSPLRVEELLRHTSGLADYRDHAPAALLTHGPDYAALMATLKDVAPTSAPGECVTESATDTLLLAAMVETLYECPADEALSRAIFTPLGMRSTGYVLTVVARDATSNGDAAPAFLPEGLRSTAADLARFQRGLIDRVALGTEEVELLSGVTHLADGTHASSGMGVRRIEFDGDTGLMIGGPEAVVAHFPAHDLVIAAAGQGPDPDLDGLVWDIAKTVVAPPAPEVRDLPLTREQMRPYLGTYQIGCTTVVIAAEGARLVLDEVDEGRTLLLNQGDDVFVSPDGSDVRVEFRRMNGRAESFVLIRDGLRSIATRLGSER